MRILYLLTSLGVGGAEKQVIALAGQMAEQGHVVSLLVLKHADEEWPVKLPVLRLNIRKTPVGIWQGLQFADKFIALFQPDIVHSHTYPANIFARLLHAMARGRSVPKYVNTIHNVYEGGWHRMALYRATSPLADRITAVSTAAADRFVRMRAVPANKMQVLTNGIDVAEFLPDRQRRRQIRAQMQVAMQAEDEFVWLAVGRLAPAKDYPNLLRAFAMLREKHAHAELWIAGEGDSASLTASDVGGHSGVHFLGLRADIADLLDAADAFVLSSAWEGMPLALGEAMAMEKPVVATAVGGVQELLGDAGLVVPAKDSGALAEGMERVMVMHESERRKMGKAARARIEKEFSLRAKAAEWSSLYAGMMEPGSL